jgi:hypothetical protein
MANFLLNHLKSFAGFLFGHFRRIFHELKQARDGIPTKEAIQDMVAVGRGTGMFSLLSLIALFVFTLLPQGKDVLLLIVEEVGVEKSYGNLIFLLVGVFLWGVTSEFGSRYAIAVTDNAGKNLNAQRVEWRKQLQKTAALVFLMLPYLIVLLGFLINYIQDDSLSGKQKNWGYGIPALLLYLLFHGVAKWYFHKQNTFFRLPKEEQEWCNKLYGIYNEYIFELRKETNFIGDSFDNLKAFVRHAKEVNQPTDDPETTREFPKDENEVYRESRVPKAFILQRKEGEENVETEPRPEGKYRWIYKVPLSFYKKLHAKLRIVVLFSVGVFLVFTFLPIGWYAFVGAPALIVTAFACYGGIYAGLLYLDFAKRWYSRYILLLLLLVSSLINKDHPVRYNESGRHDERPPLQAHFNNWFARYSSDSASTLYRIADSTSKDTSSWYPVYFVCAEGGALRTGAFAAVTLDLLRDSLAVHYNKTDFSKAVYAFSGVSGGSLGVSFFNAANYLSDPREHYRFKKRDSATHVFFGRDFLSPVIGTMFYGDILNDLIPFYIEPFDRATALEKSWEDAFKEVAVSDQHNLFSADYLSLYREVHPYPALFINTTEVESGRQCWLSNVSMNDSSLVFGGERDLLAEKIRGGVNYSTMINFSSRFPFFSPGAAVHQNEGQKFHYVDGGYVENTGCGTMLEVLTALQPQLKAKRVKPFVLVLRFSNDKERPWSNVSFANEGTEILLGIYNTRIGRSQTAQEQLRRFAVSMGGDMIVLPLDKTGSEVPMNWAMSKKSLDNIDKDVVAKWKDRKNNDLQKMIFLDTDRYIMYRDWRRKGLVKDSVSGASGSSP